MINFINGLVLPLIAAAIIPLLLHLLSRQKLKTIPFSSIKFLKELQSKRIRQVKIYQILIILIRILFILFLVLTFARPAVKTIFSSSLSGVHSSAVILLDNSLSMQAKPSVQSSFEKAISALHQVLKSFNDQDHVIILTEDPNSKQIVQFNYNQSFDDSQLKLTNFSFNLSQAVFKAQQFLKAYPNYNNEIYLITDGRLPRRCLSDSARKVLQNLPGHFYVVQALAEDSFVNMSIDSAYIASKIINLNRPVKVVANIHNQSTTSKESYISLFNDDNRLAMQLISLKAQSTKSVELIFKPTKAGHYNLTLELDDDPLQLDNQYYLSLNIPERVKILYVSSALNPEVSAALQTLTHKTNLEIYNVNESNWLAQPLTQFQVMVFEPATSLNEIQFNILEQYLKSGRSIVVIPTLNSSLTNYNHLLERLVQQKPFVDFIKPTSAEQFFVLTYSPVGLQLLLSLLEKKKVDQLSWPHFRRYIKMRSIGNVLFRFENGDPFLQELKSKQKGHVYLLAAGFSSQWSDFPYQGLFIPFLHQLFAVAAQNREENLQFKIGQAITIRLPQMELKGKFNLERPDGQQIVVLPEQTDLGLVFWFKGFTQPGHYHLKENGNVIKTFALNLDDAEWQEPFIDFNKLRSDLITIKADEVNPESLQKARLGLELWPYFLALALLMLALEMFIIRKLEQG